MGHLGEIQFSFPFPSLPLDYFDAQGLKILLGLKCIFAGYLIVYKKTLNLESVNALPEIEVSFIK